MAEVVTPTPAPSNTAWLIKYLRPIIVINMVVLLNAILVLAFFDPQKATQVAKTLTTIPDFVWTVVLGTLGAHFMGRTVEKVKGVA